MDLSLSRCVYVSTAVEMTAGIAMDLQLSRCVYVSTVDSWYFYRPLAVKMCPCVDSVQVTAGMDLQLSRCMYVSTAIEMTAGILIDLQLDAAICSLQQS